MLKPRLIPFLQLMGNDFVKTKKFKNPKYVGDPLNVIKIFNEKGVDEIMILDIEASKKGNSPNFKLLESIAEECFIPLSYGGGISNMKDAQKLFNLGVEKIVIQNSFYEDKEFIKCLSDTFGSQSIVISLDIKKNWRNTFRPFRALNHRRIRDRSLQELMQEALEVGAGELLIQIVHLEGTRSGFEANSIPEFIKAFPLPIILSGGVSSIDDVKSYIKAGADSVACGAFFVYQGPYEAVLVTYPTQSEIDLIAFE